MKELGLPITETVPATPSISRPNISPSPSLFSTSSASSSLTAPSMFSSSSVSSSSTGSSLPPPPVSSLKAAAYSSDKPLDLTSTSSPEFKVPIRPNSSRSEIERSSNALPYAIPQITRPATTSSSFSTSSISSAMPFLGSLYDSMRQSPSLYLAQIERGVCNSYS
jgi:hypothetical protein